jgi:hypothetical protein
MLLTAAAVPMTYELSFYLLGPMPRISLGSPIRYDMLTLLQSSTSSGNTDHAPGRNPDGTFTKGSEAAKELGAKGGHASHDGGASGGVSSNACNCLAHD